ncbi:DUF397 domain-containing protein [Streptomyces sp. NPDC016469]|uniref:DUF397 domain-containing protein n=1 Tax=Streptomyces sp. NPDC016469 TaxID=3157191 RepID=UPI0033F8E3BE
MSSLLEGVGGSRARDHLPRDAPHTPYARSPTGHPYGAMRRGGECVEVAAHTAAVHVRDPKNPDGPMLTVAPTN